MKLTSLSLRDGQPIPEQNAMGVRGDAGPVPGSNLSPHLAWSEVPSGTKSFTLLAVDVDAPSPENANRSDRKIPDSAPRSDFYHWILVNVPATLRELAEGLDSNGLTPKGKPPGKTDYGVRGINSYKEWFGDDPAMGGDYGGYDGPWPPFNDERTHRYNFVLYALDVEALPLPEKIRGPEVVKALRGHVLGEGRLMVTHSLAPDGRH
jgi:Raf kinase inhibitor-like YbhB/YbcL family protein